LRCVPVTPAPGSRRTRSIWRRTRSRSRPSATGERQPSQLPARQAGWARSALSEGAIQWIVAHKPSDLLSVGDSGSQAVTIAKDMLNLCDTKVLRGQDAAIAHELDDLLGLGAMQCDWVTGWARQRVGRALWLVGERAFKVQTVQTPAEESFTNTNHALDGR